MPVAKREGLQLDYLEQGSGPPVLLVHSSVSGNRQWKRLTEELRSRFRVLAPNLLGYGETTPWRGPGAQTLEDQARLLTLLTEQCREPVRIVGHSFGGSVAMKLAALLGDAASHLVLLETNPFYLLRDNGRSEAFTEIAAVRDLMKRHGARAEWEQIAERFADYWNGAGAWAAMPPERRQAFARAIAPNFHEWDAVMSEPTPLAGWRSIAARTLLVRSRNTRRPIVEIDELLRGAFPHWSTATVAEGGHMAPLARPDLVNPIVAEFLSRE